MKINQFNLKASGKMNDEEKPVVAKSRLKKILERQFPNILRNSIIESPARASPREFAEHRLLGESSKLYNNNKYLILERKASGHPGGSGSNEEPSSVCLAAMVQNYMENTEETTKCGRARCNCSNGNGKRDVNADDDDGRKFSEACEILMSLVPCAGQWERNLWADTSRFVEAANNDANALCKERAKCTNGCLRRFVMSRLRDLGYDAGICKSEWNRGCGYPSGKYEYIDVIMEGLTGEPDRLIVDIDFRSQFEIARSTNHYGAVLQKLPNIYVGKEDRLERIVGIVADAAKQSLKKKGLYVPPWRRSGYMKAKWLSPFKRSTDEADHIIPGKTDTGRDITCIAVKGSGWGSKFTSEFELQFRGAGIAGCPRGDIIKRPGPAGARNGDDQITVVVTQWQPPPVKPKPGAPKIITGFT